MSSAKWKNIAKGTMESGVQCFFYPINYFRISQVVIQNLVKFQLQNLDQASTSNFNQTSAKNIDQTSASKYRWNLNFKILTKSNFRISTKLQLYNFKLETKFQLQNLDGSYILNFKILRKKLQFQNLAWNSTSKYRAKKHLT